MVISGKVSDGSWFEDRGFTLFDFINGSKIEGNAAAVLDLSIAVYLHG